MGMALIGIGIVIISLASPICCNKFYLCHDESNQRRNDHSKKEIYGVSMETVVTHQKYITYRPSCISPLHLHSPTLSVHFSSFKPLKIIRGEGVYFYDENDETYIDCINNVALGKPPYYRK